MRIPAHYLAFPLTRILACAFVCVFAVTIHAADVEPTPIQAEIALLEDLAETQQDESLKQLVELLQKLPANANRDDRREALVATISMYIKTGQENEASKLNLELTALASANRDERASAMALNYQATFLQNDGKLSDASKIIEESLLIAQHLKDKKLISRVNSTASTIYSDLGNFKSALQYQLVAMDALEEGNRHAELRRVAAMNNISTIYLSLKDPQLSLDYNDKATKLAQSLDAQGMLATLEINRGAAYADQHKLDDATKAYMRALAIAGKIPDHRKEAIALNNLSDVALSQGHYSTCVQFALQTIALAHKQEDKSLEATAFINLGLCHMNLGNVAQGAAEVNRAINFFRESKAKPDVEDALGQLATAYENAHMYKDALKAMQEQRSLSEELFRADRDRSLSEMKAKYDASEREKQIENLEQKNQLQSIELKNKSLQRIVAILATLVAGAIALIIAVLYRKVRESNR
ncbi:MAG TPA: tetratricopeptide repeat protein, partial [Burkholderiaceae bacterium]|nr:tetratricopeptide repeat protein [Burkholderiaceae bacterium]